MTKKRIVKQVSFKQSEDDLLKYLEDNNLLDNFSYYVKSLIRKDMNNSTGPVKEIERIEKKEVKKKRNIDFEF